jgi:hypothetical protein
VIWRPGRIDEGRLIRFIKADRHPATYQWSNSP